MAADRDHTMDETAPDGIDVSILIPTWNERDNLAALLPAVRAVMDPRPESYELVIIDRDSEDGTAAYAAEAGCRVLSDPGGKGAALRKGIHTARGDIVVTMDADLSHKPAELGLLIEGIHAGYDVCVGSRFVQGGGTADMEWYRYLGNRFFLALVNLIWRMDYSDLCYGYRSFRREAFLSLDMDADGFDIETELSIRAAEQDLKILEVPSFEKARRHGNSRLKSFQDGWRILHTIIHEALPW